MNIYFFLTFILGLCFGSFLNAYLYRTRKSMSMVKPRSQCTKCGYTLGFFDLIPLLSFFFLKGKCRKCHSKIAIRYVVLELVTGILFALTFLLSDVDIFDKVSLFLFLKNLVVVFYLEFIFCYDLWYGEIPFQVTFVPGSILGFFLIVLNVSSFSSEVFGILCGAGFFLFQYIVSKGKWIGSGDIGMGFFMGAVLGYPFIVVALFLSYVGGSLVVLHLLFLKKIDKKGIIPFGTFLSVATGLTLFFGENIVGLLKQLS